MKLHVLVDNLAGKKCAAEWGLSYYIEAEKKILFDFGASDLFLQNAKKMKINPLDADFFVLSHGHWDHGNGLKYLPHKKLLCHPEAFIKRYSEDRYIGLPFGLEEGKEKFELILTGEPYQISENIFFLGEIPRNNDFESKKTGFTKEDGSEDFVMDDTGLAFKTSKGLIVLSGCAHAGICNTVEYAKKITKTEKVYAVMGGFHLKEKDELTKKTIEYLKNLKVEIVIPTHCTEFPALVEFNKNFESKPVYSGQVLTF